MVTKGRARRSSRVPRARIGFAAAASVRVSSGKASGMPCSWMAISETDLGAEGSPRRATTRARGRPWPRAGPVCSASTSSPSRAPPASPRATSQSRSVFLSMAAMRPPSAVSWKMPRTRRGPMPMRRMTRAVSVSSPSSRRPSRRSPAPRAGSSRRVRTRMRGAGASVSHSAGSAQRSPAASGPVTRRTRTGGSAPAGRTWRRRFSIAPSRARRARVCLSSTFAAPFRPKARAISRLPDWPGLSRRKARISSSEGRRFIAPP